MYLEDVEGVEDAAVGGDPTLVEGEATKREGKKLPLGLQTKDIPKGGSVGSRSPGNSGGHKAAVGGTAGRIYIYIAKH